MRKSLTKRIRITKRGKALRRSMAQGHFRAKRSKRQMRRKKGAKSLTMKKITLGKYL